MFLCVCVRVCVQQEEPPTQTSDSKGRRRSLAGLGASDRSGGNHRFIRGASLYPSNVDSNHRHCSSERRRRRTDLQKAAQRAEP